MHENISSVRKNILFHGNISPVHENISSVHKTKSVYAYILLHENISLHWNISPVHNISSLHVDISVIVGWDIILFSEILSVHEKILLHDNISPLHYNISLHWNISPVHVSTSSMQRIFHQCTIMYQCMGISHQCMVIFHLCMRIYHQCIRIFHQCTRMHQCMGLFRHCMKIYPQCMWTFLLVGGWVIILSSEILIFVIEHPNWKQDFLWLHLKKQEQRLSFMLLSVIEFNTATYFLSMRINTCPQQDTKNLNFK